MLNLTIEKLDFEEKTIERTDKQDVVFKSARVDKFFKNIDPRLRVDVALFTNTFNITYWFAGTKIYYRTRYSREFDNQLGLILHTTHKNIKSLYTNGAFDNMLEYDMEETEVA